MLTTLQVFFIDPLRLSLAATNDGEGFEIVHIKGTVVGYDAVGMLHAWHNESRIEGHAGRTVYGKARTATSSYFKRTHPPPPHLALRRRYWNRDGRKAAKSQRAWRQVALQASCGARAVVPAAHAPTTATLFVACQSVIDWSFKDGLDNC